MVYRAGGGLGIVTLSGEGEPGATSDLEAVDLDAVDLDAVDLDAVDLDATLRAAVENFLATF